VSSGKYITACQAVEKSHLIGAKLPTLITVMLHKPKKTGTKYVEVLEQNIRIKHNSSVNLTAF
jgi:hypothetical protein